MKSLLWVREPALSDEHYVVGSPAIKPKFEFNFAWLISPVPMPRPKWRAVAHKQEGRPFGRPQTADKPVDFRRGFVLRMVGRRRATVLRPIRAWEPGRERSS